MRKLIYQSIAILSWSLSEENPLLEQKVPSIKLLIELNRNLFNSVQQAETIEEAALKCLGRVELCGASGDSSYLVFQFLIVYSV